MDPVLRRAFSGSREAKEELVLRYGPELRAFIESKTGPKLRRHISVSDLTQETFMKVFRASLKTIPEGETLEGFRRRLFQNAIWMIRRQAKRYRRAVGESSCPETPRELGTDPTKERGEVTRADELAWLLLLSSRIGEKYGDILRLRAQGKEFSEIARALEITEQAARKRCERAIRALREALKARGEGGS